jgi:hypothetical protein
MSADEMKAIDALAALKRRFEKTLTSSSGCGVCRSHATKAPANRADVANAPRMIALVQPRSGASISAQTSAVSAAIERTAPSQSSRAESSSRDSGTSASAPTTRAAAIGTLMRKIPCQSTLSMRKPPATGPMATPEPAIADQIAMALGRSSSGKMLVMTERVVGMIAAAPTPIRARAAIS